MISHLSENALLDFIFFSIIHWFISIFMGYQGSAPDSAVINIENEKVDTFSMLAMIKATAFTVHFQPV